MRILLRSFAVLSALALPVVSAHATTYTFTPTLTDLTHPGDVTATFNSGSNFGPSFSFNDPTTSFYTFTSNISASNLADDDELQLDLVFSAPGTGTGSLTGDADIDGTFKFSSNEIDWDALSTDVTLSNGSVAQISIPDWTTELTGIGCSYGYYNCTGSVGSTNVTVHVTTNDPAISPTPEPSSLALLGTGILGVAGAMRRKFSL